MRFDVAVIGAGVAGAATALAARRRGLSVLLLERSGRDPLKPGETLPPEIVRPLAELGLWPAFLHSAPAASQGVYSAWGSDELAGMHALANPYGTGWQVDRARFDALVRDAATAAGAALARPARLLACERSAPADWRLAWAAPEGTRTASARVVVDAGGRGGWLPGRHEEKRRTVDRLIGITAFLEPDAPTSPVTVVEAAPKGWWYSALLPSARLVVTYLTDAEEWVAARGSPPERWMRALADTRHTRARAGASTPHRVEVFPAFSSVLLASRASDWIAVGDAALSVDPLSGQGIRHALTSSLAAAAAIESHLSGSPTALAQLDHDRVDAFARYLLARRAYYARETRWPELPFWARRRNATSHTSLVVPPSVSHRVSPGAV